MIETAKADDPSPRARAKRVLNECVGTYFLVGVDVSGAMISALADHEPSPTARSLATGLLIMVLVYATGDVSGAHFNPAVTLAFAIRGVFPWRTVPLYWAAQVLGGFLGCGTMFAIFGDVADAGATLPRMGIERAFGIEVFTTCILACAVLGTAVRHRVVGPNAAIASGAAVALGGILGRSVSGASMNPARSIASALVSGQVASLWIYIFAPLAGAVLGTALMALIHTRRHQEERAAAEGEK